MRPLLLPLLIGAAALAQIAAASGGAAVARGSAATRDEAFIGWKGDVYVPGANGQAHGGRRGESWIQTLSWRPRAFAFHNFLTDDECEHIKRLAAPGMHRSTVVGPDGKSAQDDYRTSYGSFVKRRQDAVVAAIDARVADWVRIPEVHMEDLQVLRYGHMQTYKPHMDTLGDDEAGARVATVLLYLSDVEEGGETAFPDSTHWAAPELASQQGAFSKCTEGGVAFKPRKGDALLFWSLKPDSKTEDPLSMHTGCPVLKGVKWTATKWIHARPFRPQTFALADEAAPRDPGLCEDYSPECAGWAAAGQCTLTAPYMIGDAESPGFCRRACGACTACAAGDLACYNKARRAAGYLEVEAAEAHLFPFASAAAGSGGSGGGGGDGGGMAASR